MQQFLEHELENWRLRFLGNFFLDLWALKELPEHIAAKEYAVLRGLETRSLPAVRPAMFRFGLAMIGL